MTIIESTLYSKQDFTQSPLPFAEYDNCTFTDCLFNNASLNEIIFTECRFEGCNMGNANTKGTAFKDVVFVNCKLLGLNFSICDPFMFSVAFEGCVLQLASFYRLKLKNTKFIKCNLQEADFTETDLTGVTFKECDLLKAVFQNTVLEKADLRTAYNYTLDPEVNRIKKAKFSREDLPGLLHKYTIDVY